MSAALALHSHSIAQELYEILRDLDPAQWRDDIEESVRERLAYLQRRMVTILEGAEPALNHPGVAQLRQRVHELSSVIVQHLPEQGLPVEQLQQRWNEFRVAALPRYERLAISLRAFDIHVPSLRPTNYKRNAFHALNGLLAIGVTLAINDMLMLLWIALGMATFAWTLETTRRFSTRWNGVLMKIFGPFAHPHEHWRVNSATWFCTALLGLAATQNVMVGVLGLAVLSFADPAAAIVGRRFGRVRLVNGRSLEGSLTFFAVALAAGLLLLTLAFPALAWPTRLAVAAAAGLGGALAELFARRIDDNLAVPLGTALGALGVSLLLGL